MKGYEEDLAFIHEAGFSDFATGAAPGLLAALRRRGLRSGLVVDLGCGPGHWAAALLGAGYEVLGVDRSPAMIRLAKRRAPDGRFLVRSLWDLDLPPCAAVTAIGECLNYRFDSAGGGEALPALFARIHGGLRPGGLFLFDVAEPERVPDALPRRHGAEGEGWAVLVEVTGSRRRRTLTRRIVAFRRKGNRWRRSEELHELRLYPRAQVVRTLRRAGFEVRVLPRYGRRRLLPGTVAFEARKPKA